MQRDEEEDLASDGLIAEEANTELDAIFRAICLYGGSSHMMLSNKVPVATLWPQPVFVVEPAGFISTELTWITTLVAPCMALAATPDSDTPLQAPKPNRHHTKNLKAPVAASMKLFTNESVGESVSVVIGEITVGLTLLTIPISTAIEAPLPQVKPTRSTLAKKIPAVTADPAPARKTRGAGMRAKTNANTKWLRDVCSHWQASK
jgi:hypothetical protein